MAEVVSGSNVGTVLVLSAAEAEQLDRVLHDWVDDSFTRGYDCGDPDVIASYRHTVRVLGGLFDAFGVMVEE